MNNNLFSIWKAKESELGTRLTLKQVSQETGISVPTLSRWMNGHVKRFRLTTIETLTSYFGCSVADLLAEGEEVCG